MSISITSPTDPSDVPSPVPVQTSYDFSNPTTVNAYVGTFAGGAVQLNGQGNKNWKITVNQAGTYTVFVKDDAGTILDQVNNVTVSTGP